MDNFMIFIVWSILVIMALMDKGPRGGVMKGNSCFENLGFRKNILDINLNAFKY